MDARGGGEIEEALRAFVAAEFLPESDRATLSYATPLVTSGLLDSVGTLTLVGFLEERFGVALEAHETDVHNLNTIASIARLVRAKQSR